LAGFFLVILVKNKNIQQDNDADGNAAEPEDDTFHMGAFLLFMWVGNAAGRWLLRRGKIGWEGLPLPMQEVEGMLAGWIFPAV
jgi:hypothetical protein